MPLWLLEVFTTPVALAKEFIGSLAPPHLSSRLADKYFIKTSQKRSASPTIHTSALKHKLASGSFLSIYSVTISLETTPAFLPTKQKVSSKLSNKSFYLDRHITLLDVTQKQKQAPIEPQRSVDFPFQLSHTNLSPFQNSHKTPYQCFWHN